jgi:bifunctional non-homologous end joining protein LigD
MSVTAFQRARTRGRSKSLRARKVPLPGFIEPCDPTLHERAPTGNEWVYEIKTDGYRAQVHLRDKRVTIYSRSGHDWTDEFAPIAKAASQLKVREAIIDGEATVLGNTGLPDFQALRRELGNPESKQLIYHAFDLLYLNGRDL